MADYLYTRFKSFNTCSPIPSLGLGIYSWPNGFIEYLHYIDCEHDLSL